jgi:hypothetical protein
MDPIAEQLSQLMELDDNQLAELERVVLDEVENSENQDLSSAVVERLESLASAVESVRSEQSRRVTEREALSAKAAEAAARVRGVEEPAVPEGEDASVAHRARDQGYQPAVAAGTRHCGREPGTRRPGSATRAARGHAGRSHQPGRRERSDRRSQEGRHQDPGRRAGPQEARRARRSSGAA